MLETDATNKANVLQAVSQNVQGPKAKRLAIAVGLSMTGLPVHSELNHVILLWPQAKSVSQLAGLGLATAVCYDCYGTQMATCSEQGVVTWKNSDSSSAWSRRAVLPVRCFYFYFVALLLVRF